MPRTDRRRKRALEREPETHGDRALLLVVAGALAVKLAVLAAFHDHPLLQPDSGLDTGAYVALARRVAAGNLLLGHEPYFLSPLYVYVLGAVFAITSGSLFAARLLQAFLGAAAAGLLFVTARRLFGERAALLGSALYVLTGVVTFHEVLLLQAALDPFLTALALFLFDHALSRYAEGQTSGWSFLATGLTLGAFSLNRPNMLLVLAGVTLIVALARRAGGWRAAAVLAGGAALAIAPVTARNLFVAKEPVLISSHGGLNLLIGNGPEADGTFHLVDGISPSIEGQARDARRVAEDAVGRRLTTREVSTYFTLRALAWVRAHPAAEAKLLLRKLGLLLNRIEAPLNFSYPWYARSRLTPLSVLVVGAGILVPLGLLGLGLRLADPVEARIPYAVWVSFVPLYALSVVLFFVSSRYRLPLLLPLAAGAGFAIDSVWRAVAERRWKAAGVLVAILVPLAAVSWWPMRVDEGSANEETEMVVHDILNRRDADARRRLESLAPQHPLPGVLWFRAGRAWIEAGKPKEAIDALQRSLAIDANQEETLISLATAQLQNGDVPAALAAFGRIPSAPPEKRAGEHAESAAIALLQAGRNADAMPFLRETVRLAPSRASAHQNLAALLAESGRLDDARREANEALRLDPKNEKAKQLLGAIDRASRSRRK